MPDNLLFRVIGPLQFLVPSQFQRNYNVTFSRTEAVPNWSIKITPLPPSLRFLCHGGETEAQLNSRGASNLCLTVWSQVHSLFCCRAVWRVGSLVVQWTEVSGRSECGKAVIEWCQVWPIKSSRRKDRSRIKYVTSSLLLNRGYTRVTELAIRGRTNCGPSVTLIGIIYTHYISSIPKFNILCTYSHFSVWHSAIEAERDERYSNEIRKANRISSM